MESPTKKKLVIAGASLLPLLAIALPFVPIDRAAFGQPESVDPTQQGQQVQKEAQEQVQVSHTQSIIELAEKIVPSVVNVSTVSTVKGPRVQGSPEDLFRRFFEDFFGGQGAPGMPPGIPAPGPGAPHQAAALGTGFVIDKEGLILTNNHVIAGADEINVSFKEEPEQEGLKGEVVGRDPELDIALIRVKTDRELQALAFGSSEGVRVGEYVIAVGNPFGQGHSVTHGIISAKGRLSPDLPLVSYLQTDAPINPGNSGGPLVNLNGEVVGVNNAIIAQAQNIGFAIPVDVVKQVLPQLKTKGKVTRGYLGVLLNELTPEIAKKMDVEESESAPFVTHVVPDSPAAKAGLKPYDVILQFDGQKVDSALDLMREVSKVEVGKEVPVQISRKGDKKKLQLKIAERPAPPEQEQLGGEQGEGNGREAPSDRNAGLALQDLNPEIARQLGVEPGTKGVVVMDVRMGSPAQEAGLMRGDLIVEVERKPVSSVSEFYSRISEEGEYLLRVRRPTPDGRDAYAVIMLEIGGQSDE